MNASLQKIWDQLVLLGVPAESIKFDGNDASCMLTVDRRVVKHEERPNNNFFKDPDYFLYGHDCDDEAFGDMSNTEQNVKRLVMFLAYPMTVPPVVIDSMHEVQNLLQHYYDIDPSSLAFEFPHPERPIIRFGKRSVHYRFSGQSMNFYEHGRYIRDMVTNPSDAACWLADTITPII